MYQAIIKRDHANTIMEPINMKAEQTINSDTFISNQETVKPQTRVTKKNKKAQ
jgi:intergrase/recombinase